MRTFLTFVAVKDITNPTVHDTFILHLDMISHACYTMASAVYTVHATGVADIVKVREELAVFYGYKGLSVCLNIEVSMINVTVHFIPDLDSYIVLTLGQLVTWDLDLHGGAVGLGAYGFHELFREGAQSLLD